jgi:diguanylate cyclase (GGDEF)-like protein
LTGFKGLIERSRRLGLVTRFAVISVAMLLLIQLAVQGVIRTSIENSITRNLQSELESSTKVWSRLVEQNAQRLQLGASVLAADFGFRSAISSGDAQTISSALENNGARIGATVAGFLDTEFKLVAISIAVGEADVQTKTSLEVLGKSMVNDSQKGRLTLAMGRLHQFVLVPVRAPLTIGWVVMGFPVDQSLPKDMVALTATDVVILSKAAPGVLRSVAGSIKPDSNFVLSPGAGTDQPYDLDGEQYLVRPIDQPGLSPDLQVVLLRPSSVSRQVFEYMKTALWVIDAFGLLLFALGTMAMARQISKPLALLIADTLRLRRGDYSQKIDDFGHRDEVGRLARSFDDMRQSIQASQAEIRQLAYWDRLTGLPNRAQLRELLQSVLTAAGGDCKRLTVIVLDLDRFKHINDVLGYGFGDKVLQTVGARLKDLAVSEHGQVARIAGGQFAFVLPHLDVAQAIEVTHRISSALEVPVAFDGQTVDLRAGMGIASWPEHAGDVDVLLGHAEVAMYSAKRKNAGVQVYDPALDSGSALTLSMLSELRRAIDLNELRLFLQPKIDLRTHQVVAAEALVRWQHPTRGMVPPMEFIPFAEQTGFVRHLTLWMLEEVARQWHSLQPQSGVMRIAINLSTRDLMDQDFPSKIGTLLAQHNAPLEGFCLEITESAIMDDPERAEATLNQLADGGYKLSIDDFGTGYSSLAYLKRLPVTELKIDKSFVLGMENSESDAQIVRSTIELAHNLGLSVVAEGVETAGVYRLLGELHCDEGQGYYMSKPMPANAFVAWREAWLSRQGA